MKQIRDAIVIGSGIVGSATALALIRANIRRVTLIEKGPLTSGMTRRNPGLVHPFLPHRLLTELARDSYATYSQWAMNLPGKSAFVETGAAVVANEDARQAFAEWSAHAGSVNPLAPDLLRAMFPSVSSRFDAALFTQQAGYADAVLTAQAMVNAGKERGLETQTGTQVKQILVQQHHVTGVTTTTGELEAPTIIVAAGGWSERLLMPLGVPLRLKYHRGVVVFYEQPQPVQGELPMLLDRNGTYFFRPHPYHMSAAGHVALESQTQGVDALNEFVSQSDQTTVKEYVEGCVPAFANVTPKRSHAVLFDTLTDGLPALGRVPGLDGLFVAAGFGTSAFAVAPAVGHLLAQTLIDGSSPRDISAFDPKRKL